MSTVNEIQAIFSEVEWEDAFVKSMRFESPTSVTDGKIIAAGCLGDVEIILETVDPEYPRVRLRCRRVHEFRMSFCFDLDPQVQECSGRFRLRLLRVGEHAVEAESIEIELQ